MGVSIGGSGGRVASITRLSSDPADYVFVDGSLNVVNMNQVNIKIINYGGGVGALMAWVECDVHNWVGTGPPYRLETTTFPPNTLMARVAEIGTVFGSGEFTQTPGNANGPVSIAPNGSGIIFEVINGIQPNNNFSDWTGQFIFTYT